LSCFLSFEFGENFKGCLFSNGMQEKEFINEETYNIPKKYFNLRSTQIEKNLLKAKEDGGLIIQNIINLIA